jgi:Rho termination factor-like protein
MFGQSKTQMIGENAISASTVALQFAQNRKLRKRLLSALKHTSEARRRTRRGLGLTGTIARLASDQAVQSELRGARSDLQRAYQQLDANRRRRRMRRFTLLTALASLVAAPRLRGRVTNMILTATGRRHQPADTTNRVPQRGSSSDSRSRPGSLEDLTREELYARAQEKEIPGRSEMSKQELVDALRAKS